MEKKMTDFEVFILAFFAFIFFVLIILYFVGRERDQEERTKKLENELEELKKKKS